VCALNKNEAALGPKTFGMPLFVSVVQKFLDLDFWTFEKPKISRELEDEALQLSFLLPTFRKIFGFLKGLKVGVQKLLES
jgi:hypothetical protein